MVDSDIYRRQSRNPNDEDYYELFLVYENDVLCCLHNHQLIMDTLALTYDLKDGSLGPPKIYLSNEIKKYQVRTVKYHWKMPSKKYKNIQ